MIISLVEKLKENYFVNFIYVYVFLMPWNFFNGQMGLLTVILFILFLFNFRKEKLSSEFKSLFTFKPFLFLVSFLIFIFLSLFWTENLNHAFSEDVKFYKYYSIVFFILYISLSGDEAFKVFKSFIVSIGLYAIFSILIYSFSLLEFTDPRGILAYAVVTPYMAIGSLSSIVIVLNTKNNIERIVFLLFSIIFTFALIINLGRGAQLAFLFTIVVLLIANYKRVFRNLLIVLSVFFILISGVFALNHFGKLDRMKTGFNELMHLKENDFSGSWAYRAYMWYAAGDIILKNPLVGVGAGDNIDEFKKFTKTHPSKATWMGTFHNQHLDFLTKYGIIGYGLFLTSIFLLIISLKSNMYICNLAIVFFSITLFDAFADIILHMKPYNNIFILMFTLMTILSVKKTNNSKVIDGTMV